MEYANAMRRSINFPRKLGPRRIPLGPTLIYRLRFGRCRFGVAVNPPLSPADIAWGFFVKALALGAPAGGGPALASARSHASGPSKQAPRTPHATLAAFGNSQRVQSVRFGARYFAECVFPIVLGPFHFKDTTNSIDMRRKKSKVGGARNPSKHTTRPFRRKLSVCGVSPKRAWFGAIVDVRSRYCANLGAQVKYMFARASVSWGVMAKCTPQAHTGQR